MRSPRLGACNLALISLYFAPVWGTDAVRALMSPFGGFEDRSHAVAAIYLREIFDFGLAGLMRTSSVLAGIKLVVAAAFVAYLIEFARALVIGRQPNRETSDLALAFAVGAIVIWAVSAVALGDAAAIRLCATQLLLVTGAVVVITVERQAENSVVAAEMPNRDPAMPGLASARSS